MSIFSRYSQGENFVEKHRKEKTLIARSLMVHSKFLI